MKGDIALFVQRAVLAYTRENENDMLQAKLGAFLYRRRLAHTQEHGTRGSICDLYPSLPIEGIGKISATLGTSEIKDLAMCVTTMVDDDPEIAAAFFRWSASQRRITRSVGMSAVTAVRRAVASTGAKVAVAGEFARHKDTIDNLIFVVDVTGTEQVAAVSSAVEAMCKTTVTAVSSNEYRFSVQVHDVSIVCFMHMVEPEDMCASIVWHTGPDHFIKKVNARLARYGFELTADGMRNHDDMKPIWCATETAVWDIMGVPTPPTSARDVIDDVLCDTASIVMYDTHTVDTGIMLRDGGIPESMRVNLDNGMKDLSLGGLVVIGTRDVKHTRNEIEKARGIGKDQATATPIGLLITANSLPSLDLASSVDYLVVEDDELYGLYTSALPAAVRAHKNVVVRNPLMYINGMCMLDSAITKSEALRRLEMMGTAVEITGGLCYEGTPTEAVQDIVRTKCKVTLGSACDPWAMTQGIYTARVRCCKALVQQSRLMSDQDFLSWLD